MKDSSLSAGAEYLKLDQNSVTNSVAERTLG